MQTGTGCYRPLILGLIGLCTLVGCRTVQRPEQPGSPEATGVRLSAAVTRNLERDLWRFARYAENAVARTADRIEARSEDTQVRRAALAWKLELLVDMQEDLAEKQPLRTLVDFWALWVRVVHYLQEGAGQNLFGEFQPQALSTASDILSEIEELAGKYIPGDQQGKILEQINKYAREHPIQGVFDHDSVRDFDEAEEGRSVFQSILEAPWVAMGRVGEGLDPTARLAASVDRFRELMTDYPALVRWQLQLLFLDVERMPSFKTIVASIKQATDTAADFNETVRALPEQWRVETEKLVEQIDAQQPELQNTLGKARQTIKQADEALTRAEQVAQRVSDVTAELTRAGQAWEQTAQAVAVTVEQIQQFGKDGTASATQPAATQPSTDSRPFDIRNYTDTAKALQSATIELRLLLAELNDFAEGGAIDDTSTRAGALADEVLLGAEGRLRGVVDHVFWRAVLLTGLIAVIVILYRLVSRHRGRRSEH